MKRFSVVAAAVLAVAFAATLGWAQAAPKPINRKCPLKPDVRIDPTCTVQYKGKLIGLCCTDCLDKWKKNPDGIFAKVVADANKPVEPDSAKDASSALASGKGGGYLTILFFSDKSAGSQAMLKAISDLSVESEISKCSYANVEFKKDSKDAEAFKVTAAPTVLFLDPTQDPPKELKRLTTAGAGAILKEIKDGMKKMGK
ncbi:MAG TPA: hypothetical protein VEN81_17260 [Planctomycetota bacterium]|nr:hypothetical protein [Planctomycetota bacterium]